MTFPRAHKIVVTGAAGLVGQNLLVMLQELGFTNLVAIDRHEANLAIVRTLCPGVKTVCADLAVDGDWREAFTGGQAVVILHAQITGLHEEDLQRNNVRSTEHVLTACRQHNVQRIIHVSSSVVLSVVDDAYVRTKRAQEELVRTQAPTACILRPTLMFGWFDPKHLGWLSRLMERTPVFPIPGDGKFMRQPLYCRDFCRVIVACLENARDGQILDITGAERIDYVDLVRAIRDVKGLRTRMLHIPVALFDAMLRAYAKLDAHPPFTAAQLHALMAGDDFSGVNVAATFGFAPTPLRDALRETFTHPRFSRVVVER